MNEILTGLALAAIVGVLFAAVRLMNAVEEEPLSDPLDEEDRVRDAWGGWV